MGPGFSVIIDELRRAGLAAARAGEAAAAVRLADAVDGVGPALPGSRVAAQLPALGVAWRGQLDAWRTNAGEYGADLVAAADL